MAHCSLVLLVLLPFAVVADGSEAPSIHVGQFNSSSAEGIAQVLASLNNTLNQVKATLENDDLAINKRRCTDHTATAMLTGDGVASKLLLMVLTKQDEEQKRLSRRLERLEEQQVHDGRRETSVVGNLVEGLQQLLTATQQQREDERVPVPSSDYETSPSQTNSDAHVSRPRDCYDILNGGFNRTGDSFEIFPSRCEGAGSAVLVRCDEGWTVVLDRREADPQIDFNRGWFDYKNGFGDPTTEYWIGNEALHQMTTARPQVLRVELQDWDGRQRWAEYHTFMVEGEPSQYRIHLNEYSGDAGNALGYHDNMPFTTIDRDNDNHGSNCAQLFKGGFWYKSCHQVSSTSLLLPKQTSTSGLTWNSWYPDRTTLAATTYKIKPKTCD